MAEGSLSIVHVASLKLRSFRNYPRLEVAFPPGFHLLLGSNAQGKTNILEAIYLIATLRSFRGVGSAQMVAHGQKNYFVGATVVGAAEYQIKLYWSAEQKKLGLNGQPVRRLTDYLGVLRAVVFCTEDLLLVKGPPSARRRFLDLLLCQTQPSYLLLLQRYARALRSRNTLLKRDHPDAALLESFSAELVAAGSEICNQRRQLLPFLASIASQAYKRISNDAEELRVHYAPNIRGDMAVELAQSRNRERNFRGTLVGPHRDDLHLLLNEQAAAQFGSEGQKRSIALALKMAQAEYVTGFAGISPVLLIDDVMGELDASRRAGFLPLLDQAQRSRGQVFMTCTEENWPHELGSRFHRWIVRQGTLAGS